VVLHGAGSDPDTVFDKTDLRALAEARGVIVVAPMGYNRFGGYGDIYPVIVTKSTASQGGKLKAGSGAGAGAAGSPPPARPVEPTAPAAPDDYLEMPASKLIDPDIGPLSEQDVMAVLGQVRAEYRIDARRIYLLGNSMGGAGTLYLAAKYPQLWAAIAPAGGPVAAWSYPYARLREHHVAVLFVHGERDEHSNAVWSKALADRARAEGVEARLLVVPGQSHVRAWAVALPQIFDFLLSHAKPK
jgi:dienelactone hydrolase